MANRRAKSGSPNGSAMRPIHGEESCSMPSLGNYWNFGRSADHRPIHLMIRQWSSARPMCLFPIHSSDVELLGPVGDLGTLAKEVWRVANLEVSWPNEAHINCSSLLVRPPTLQAINQAWCCQTGSSFKLHMFPCKAWNSLLIIHPLGPRASILVNTTSKR
uniref:Uncharacterized protein n=1 Tax=Solanum tuberosum TaxID=4113 RepID=M1DA33_SOLTU